MELIKERLDTDVFFAAYEEVRSAVAKKKLKRKRDAKIEAITNPELYAKKKIKHNLNKQLARKRKNQEYAVNRTPLKVKKSVLGDDVKTAAARLDEL